MHRHRPCVERCLVAPDAAHQLVAPEHAAGVPGEEREEVELLRGELDVGAVDHDTAARRLDMVAPGTKVQGLRVPGSFIDSKLGESGGISSEYLRGSGTSSKS